ncbi:MAG: hypothetical protein EOM59_08160 [Clostridia bacterium]|nr:hypothetical protein [Clostridia bacterium]
MLIMDVMGTKTHGIYLFCASVDYAVPLAIQGTQAGAQIDQKAAKSAGPKDPAKNGQKPARSQKPKDPQKTK